ncbi:hypothetical protein ABC795_04240 [Blastococcus sp. HT6-30]|uniref:DUF6907 domain-containing protein n=1 Tax=Blastococcus sp. HT6-30 TaxID=3144843 RepID=UPI00321B77BF
MTATPVPAITTPSRDCPSWCVSDEHFTDGHPDDQVLVHSGAPDIVKLEAGPSYEIRIKRYDWFTSGGEEPQILLDDEPFTAVDARKLAAALTAAADLVEGDPNA